MTRTVFSLLFCLLFVAPAMADDLNIYLGDLDRQAASDRRGFTESVGSYYGVTGNIVDEVLRSTGRASDAFMIFELARMTGLSRDRVMRTYEERKGQGWGAMAKELGIKPGSAEFHALKRGDFDYRRKYSGKGFGKDAYDDRDSNDSPGKSKKGDSGKGKKGKPDDLVPESPNGNKGGGKGKK